jgi:leucine dehydrogenase
MAATSQLLSNSLQEFIGFLKEQKINRFYFVYDSDNKQLISSHPQLQPIADYFIADKRDFMEHEGFFVQLNHKYNTLLGAFVHQTKRGQAAGGVRYWHYTTMEDYFRDGLRLAKGMTRKNALAGLWWGGGKGVMSFNPALDKMDKQVRKELYEDYGRFMTSLGGCYVTAEDVGTNVTDMEHIFSQTRFTTCIPSFLGGSGNPSIPTAQGVVCGMEAALEFCRMGTLENKMIAVQGMGNVSQPLIRFLFEKGAAKVTASDIFPELAAKVKKMFKSQNFEALLVKAGDDSIFRLECDILSPCATGAVLNSQTIPLIKAKIICGAANNQLEDTQRDDQLLFDNGKIYVPDFLTNRMGIVNCANEQYGFVDNDPAIEQHLTKEWEFSIHQTALNVLQSSKKNNLSSAKIALEMADKLSLEEHPIFGHRGVQIIQSLAASGWAEQDISD